MGKWRRRTRRRSLPAFRSVSCQQLCGCCLVDWFLTMSTNSRSSETLLRVVVGGDCGWDEVVLQVWRGVVSVGWIEVLLVLEWDFVILLFLVPVWMRCAVRMESTRLPCSGAYAGKQASWNKMGCGLMVGVWSDDERDIWCSWLEGCGWCKLWCDGVCGYRGMV